MNMEAGESHLGMIYFFCRLRGMARTYLAYVEFIGSNFTSNITVWLDLMELETCLLLVEKCEDSFIIRFLGALKGLGGYYHVN